MQTTEKQVNDQNKEVFFLPGIFCDTESVCRIVFIFYLLSKQEHDNAPSSPLKERSRCRFFYFPWNWVKIHVTVANKIQDYTYASMSRQCYPKATSILRQRYVNVMPRVRQVTGTSLQRYHVNHSTILISSSFSGVGEVWGGNRGKEETERTHAGRRIPNVWIGYNLLTFHTSWLTF